MRYFQKYSYDEHNHGTQTVIFAVSDSYEELFEDSGTETDIFVLESSQEDFNIQDGRYAIDELTFSINELACQTDDDRRALHFCLNAENIYKFRYCAIFLGEEPSEANRKFVGQIGSKISGEDLIWNNNTFGTNVIPAREYSFSAYAFDVSVLADVKLNSIIRGSDLSIIPNLRDRLKNDAGFKALFQHRPSFALSTNPSAEYYGNVAYTAYLGNLHAILQYMLDVSSDIILELHGILIEFELLESFLGFETSPCKYEFKSNNKSLQVKKVENNPDVRLKLYLSSSESLPANSSAVYVHRKLIDENFGAVLDNEGNIKFEFQQNNVLADSNLSFMELDSIETLLFLIARAFGLYYRVAYSSNKISLKLVPRNEVLETTPTYIYGAKEASIDISVISTKEANKYYSQSTAYTSDGIDKITNEPGTYKPGVSEMLKKDSEKRQIEKQRKNIEYEKLLFSTSPVLIRYRGSGSLDTLHPVNLLGLKADGLSDWELKNFDVFGYMNYPLMPDNPIADYFYNHKECDYLSEYLHNSIYVKSLPFETTNISLLGSTPVWRPAINIFVKIENQDLVFNTLAEYITFISERDVKYYQREYSLTIPYWNGFSKNSDGSNPSWKNIKLGSKIIIQEHSKVYNDGVWVEGNFSIEYVVIGIETNYQKPETTLKLNSLERFDFNNWDGNLSDVVSIVFQLPDFSTQSPSVIEENVTPEEIETIGTIEAGDVVMINPDRKVFKAENKSEYYHYPIGIALSSGSTGETIVVQLSGIVKSERYNFLQAGKMIQLRLNPTGINLSTTLLEDKTADEDMIVILGTSLSPDSFYLDICKMIIE